MSCVLLLYTDKNLGTIEPIAKLQFWPKFAFSLPDMDFFQIAYAQWHMIDLEKTNLALKPSKLVSKANFAIGSIQKTLSQKNSIFVKYI